MRDREVEEDDSQDVAGILGSRCVYSGKALLLDFLSLNDCNMAMILVQMMLGPDCRPV